MNEHPLFDTHAHYHDPRFDNDPGLPSRDELLSSLFRDTVSGIVNIGTDPATSREALTLANKYDGMYAAVGMYPGSCPLTSDPEIIRNGIREIRQLLADPKVVAIGEIGFDFHYDDVPRDIQALWFEEQMKLAAETGYPVVIHDREAHGAVMDMIMKYPSVHGIFHSYSGSAEMAEDLVRRGWYISFSGVLTFKNAQKAVETARVIPHDRILIETDAPYLTPVPFRGKPNHSGYLVHTAKRLSEIIGLSYEDTADITVKNAHTVFRIP